MSFLSHLFSPVPKYNYDSLIYETRILAKSSIVPLMNSFPEFEEIVFLNLLAPWELFMSIAMTGVAANTRGYLDKKDSICELRNSIDKTFKNNNQHFDDYLNFTLDKTQSLSMPWSAISAYWVAENLKFLPEATEKLKIDVGNMKFVNILSLYMNIAYGDLDVGFSKYLINMCHTIEKEQGIDMGFNTPGTKIDQIQKIVILGDTIEKYASSTAKMIKDKIESST